MSRAENKLEQRGEVTISRATPEDAEGMLNVFYQAWLVTYPNSEVGIIVDDIEDHFREALTPEGLAMRRERLAHLPKGHVMLVARVSNEIVGVCHVIEHAEQNELKAIYVLPEYQRLGVGGLLWAEAQKFLNPEKETTVHVATYNSKAIEFYKKLGFRETGRHWQDAKWKMKSGAIIPEMEMVLPSGEESQQAS